MRERHLSRACRQWHTSACQMTREKAVLHRAVARIVQGSLAVALSKWRGAANLELNQGSEAESVVRRLRHAGSYARAWTQWRHMAALWSTLYQMGRSAGAKMMQTKLHTAWHSWREDAGRRVRQRDIVSSALYRMEEQGVSRAYHRWCANASQMTEERDVMHRCVARLMHGTTAAAMSTWREAAAAQQATVELGLRAVSH